MKNKKHVKRVKKLALLCTLCTIILAVSTYAWFIGMKTVNVSSFDVEIAATDGLSLSLNGQTWAETVAISSASYKDPSKQTGASAVYASNTNTWGGKGLIPISTVGEISSTDSRLIMYEKGSLTATKGGYRLMASKVDNSLTKTGTGEEGSGFVAFDLFIRNLSGNEYYTGFNQLNEEAIYLTQNSKVSVVSSGSDQQELTGIENSVRVGFAQIGRVEAVKDNEIGADVKVQNATADKKLVESIQGIKCTSVSDGGYDSTTGVTGICTRYAQIWEPNDKAHVTNAINWYDTACVKRTGAASSFAYATENNKCTTVANNSYSQTYAVGSVIDYTNYVDVYDGAAYNKYSGTVANETCTGDTPSTCTYDYIDAYSRTTGTDKVTLASGKLYAYDYFTDTEKMLTGMDRPTFITLAPNSITKVRVYVWLEGQDVDNYDFASLGKKISVSFGFTKERFFDSDISYQGPTTDADRDITIPTTAENQG